MGTIREDKFSFWQSHGKNLLLIGLSGTGKTAMIRESLEKNGLKIGESVAYYSSHAGDFVGDPTTAKVLLFDTLNDPQAQKAVQEVLGLKVWKGKPVAASVWASYTVGLERIDPDSKTYHPVRYEWSDVPKPITDAFEVAVEVPYKPCLDWFTANFGERIAKASIEWWGDLDQEEQYKVSPRRLADALRMYRDKGDMRDVLPISSNVSKLMVTLNTGPITEKLESLMKAKDEAGAKTFLANENNYASSMKHIPKSEAFKEFFLPLLPEEKLLSLMGDESDHGTGHDIFNYVIQNAEKVQVFREITVKALNGPFVKLAKKIRRMLSEGPSGVAGKVADYFDTMTKK